MLKECVVLNGLIINIGEWDYQYIEVEGGQVEQNPLPDGATVEQRELEFDPDRGWYEVGTSLPPTPEERLATMESALMELLLGGL